MSIINNKVTQNKKSRFSILLLIFYIFGVVLFFFGSLPSFSSRKLSNYSTRQKACYSNIRVIQGAVEMYNTDSKELMNNLDIDNLIKGHNLKEEPSKPETSCNYTGNDLNDLGSVYCTYHGDLQGATEGQFGKDEVKINERRRIMEIFYPFIVSLFWPIIVIYLFILLFQKIYLLK